MISSTFFAKQSAKTCFKSIIIKERLKNNAANAREFRPAYLDDLALGDSLHCSDAIMSAMVSQFTGVSIVWSTICSIADQKRHQSSASLALVRGIYRLPVNSPIKDPMTRKKFPFNDVIMYTHEQWLSRFVSRFGAVSAGEESISFELKIVKQSDCILNVERKPVIIPFTENAKMQNRCEKCELNYTSILHKIMKFKQPVIWLMLLCPLYLLCNDASSWRNMSTDIILISPLLSGTTENNLNKKWNKQKITYYSFINLS